MTKLKWNEITSEDVINAIYAFEFERPDYPAAKSTFLIYNGKKYPAKHIRGMAYKIHFGVDISKNDYAGGKETEMFFKKLGFEVQYTHKSVITHPVIHKTNPPKLPSPNKSYLKIGLYLQDNSSSNTTLRNHFKSAMNKVKASDIDILVLPEHCYTPFEREFDTADFMNENDINRIYELILNLSRDIERAIVVCHADSVGRIMSVYANAFAVDGETKIARYFKHTMTYCSPLEMRKYEELAQEIFQPIILKGNRIGMTICYDCNHSMFSRKFGLNKVDILINSTGGDVIYDKWFKYNKARSIENNCFSFVTMAASQNKNNSHSYVYGFTPTGKEMAPVLLNKKDDDNHSISEGIYVYDTASDDKSCEVDRSLNQKESVNKHQDMFIPAIDIMPFFTKATKITNDIRVCNHNGSNIVLCAVKEMDIMEPEKVLKLLYSPKIQDLPNKKYLLINYWNEVDEIFYDTKLSLILKVRAMENYCAVVLNAQNKHICFQSGQNRTAQIVKEENEKFGIDLSRMGGPDTIWQNKDGMRASWRKNIEWLISSM
ncbi:carbon-nitrogen hydrolase family protein [Ruminococcus flavefaciens]|uniref:carbon-nitrogen hydrolase family protein n=1 Tax=Ruminococcus flavefaciens TaxID=1265 RepID=UPI0026EDC4A8|nr:carbon-nitrogen hydrolase family protein [Ruminococcus flavefaciens]